MAKNRGLLTLGDSFTTLLGCMLSKAYRKLDYWERSLGLNDKPVTIQKISPMQVTNNDGLPGASFVGIVIEDSQIGTAIVTTRKLSDDDIVHELLHLKNLDLDHFWVEVET